MQSFIKKGNRAHPEKAFVEACGYALYFIHWDGGRPVGCINTLCGLEKIPCVDSTTVLKCAQGVFYCIVLANKLVSSSRSWRTSSLSLDIRCPWFRGRVCRVEDQIVICQSAIQLPTTQMQLICYLNFRNERLYPNVIFIWGPGGFFSQRRTRKPPTVDANGTKISYQFTVVAKKIRQRKKFKRKGMRGIVWVYVR